MSWYQQNWVGRHFISALLLSKVIVFLPKHRKEKTKEIKEPALRRIDPVQVTKEKTIQHNYENCILRYLRMLEV